MELGCNGLVDKYLLRLTLRKKCLRISPYSVQMQENTDQKKLRIWTLFT